MAKAPFESANAVKRQIIQDPPRVHTSARPRAHNHNLKDKMAFLFGTVMV